MTTGKTTALTRWTFAGKVMSLLFNMLSMLVTTFLPRSKRLLISCVYTHTHTHGFILGFSIFCSTDLCTWFYVSTVLFCFLCMYAQSCPTLCDPMDIAHQAPLSVKFPRQEYWSGLPFPTLRNSGIELTSVSSASAGRFITTGPPGEQFCFLHICNTV